MEALLTINELLKAALAQGAVGFTLRSRLHPVIYPEKGVQTYASQPTTSEEIEEVLRQLVKSRELRQYRENGVVHFRCSFAGIPLLGGARRHEDEVRLELRKMAS